MPCYAAPCSALPCGMANQGRARQGVEGNESGPTRAPVPVRRGFTVRSVCDPAAILLRSVLSVSDRFVRRQCMDDVRMAWPMPCRAVPCHARPGQAKPALSCRAA
eukprot:692663-Lingulodinium_polyedra.AAC.1